MPRSLPALSPLRPAPRRQLSTVVKVIGPDEYDAAVTRTPHACPLYAVADHRRVPPAMAAAAARARRAAFAT